MAISSDAGLGRRPRRSPSPTSRPSPGPGGAEDCVSPAGFTARIDMQNAEGGVNGHKLVPLVIDDQTSPSEIATAVQEADSKAFGIVSQSPLFFLAAKYPQQAGVPVTGSYSDGPEWGEQPYTNMFASDDGSVDPKYPVNTQIGDFLKATAATSSGRTATASRRRRAGPPSRRRLLQACRRQDRRREHLDPLRQRRLHQHRADRQAGGRQRHRARHGLQLELRPGRGARAGRREAQGALYATGYEPDVINSPAWSSLQGGYFLRSSARGCCPTPAPSRCSRPWRSTRTSPRASSPASASTRPGRART